MKRATPRLAATAIAAVLMVPAAATAQPSSPLRGYNVDPAMVSVSGHSNGADMAMQLGFAYSSRIMGVGVFADAQAYNCRRDDNPFSDECSLLTSESVAGLESTIRDWSGTRIDPVHFVGRQRIYAFVGKEYVAKATTFPKVARLYERFVPATQLRYRDDVEVNNSFPTDFDHPYSNQNQWECTSQAQSVLGNRLVAGALNAPLANCNVDGAGETLEWIYGPLNERADAPNPTSLVAVDQSEFIRRLDGMDDVGYLYVPGACASGAAACRLHIFFHACGQSAVNQDRFFPWYSGHARWAETNNIVVFFPQTYPDPNANNVHGCWDTAKIYGTQFNQRGGTQIEAIMKMVARITSGYGRRAVEYRHASFGHYFISADDDEIAKLDTAGFDGWARTGEHFAVRALGTSGATGVCRFFGLFGTKSSHFYALDGPDCDGAKKNPDWQFEGLRFAVYPADAAEGCSGGMQPVFRLYNDGKGAAPNHRYTTSTVIRAQMIAEGWIPEGVGDGVVACTTQ